MENTNLILKFSDINECAKVSNALGNADLSRKSFRIASPVERLNLDNTFLTVFLTFVEHGGLGAITAFLTLLCEIVKQRGARVEVEVNRGDSSVKINGNSTNDQIAKAANELNGPQ